ncbi:MAG: hypothetical protein BWY46_01377 [Firmicutes bacterium ADurb.Bin300]|nr:MAG: hypothetical protein BWY46_01377 [Firmicutes bacterium ADurb.Bin300]
MATYTSNLNLKKPAAGELFDIADFNSNSDKIDTAVGNRVVKNANITAGTKTKITYDTKGLVTGGADLTPSDIPTLTLSKISDAGSAAAKTAGTAPGNVPVLDEDGRLKKEQLPIEPKAHVLVVDGVAIYGSRFVDVDDYGNPVLREDGSGDYLITVLEDETVKAVDVITQVNDGLDSQSPTEALSAKQGGVLRGFIGTLANLLTTAKESLVEAINEVVTALTNHTNDADNPHGVTKSQVGLSNVDNTSDTDKPVSTAVSDALALKAPINNPTFTGTVGGITKAMVGLGNVDNTADSNKEVLSATKLKTARKINGVDFDGTADITIADSTKIPTTQKGAANGVAELDDAGKVPSSQLPSYVDDIIEGTLSTFPQPGETGKIYVDTETNLTYRWGGTQYAEVSQSLALGETSSTAYAGNKGKQNADNIETLQGQVQTAQDDISSLSENKADLSNGKVPKEQLPYFNESQTVYVGDTALYGTTLMDVDEQGNPVLRENGQGDYLLAVTFLGVPFLKYIGNAVTDDITGIKYSFTISNGNAILQQII